MGPIRAGSSVDEDVLKYLEISTNYCHNITVIVFILAKKTIHLPPFLVINISLFQLLLSSL